MAMSDMVVPDTTRRYTADEVLAFPDDGNRYELVHGELLVTPSPAQRHEIVLVRLTGLMYSYLAPLSDAFQMFASRGDVFWSDEDYVQPDLFVVPAAEVTGDWKDCQHLLLAVEVISPSSARGDRVKKRKLYQERRVATYWVVDPNAQLIEIWRPGDERPEIVTDTLPWRVAEDASELAIRLEELFAKLPA